MKVPFFDLRRLYLDETTGISSAVREALDSGHYILGKQGESFETEMAAYLLRTGAGAGAAHIRGCNSGTDALVLSLLAAGIGPGDEVLVPSLTAIPTITAVKTVGAQPVFVDIDPLTWVMSPVQALALRSPRTKAVIAVHLYGNPVDLRPLLASGLIVIEDVAQAMGARFHGAAVGTVGRFGAFSFYPTKNLGALGDAGAVCAASAEDAERVAVLRNYGQKDRYNAELPRGINSRLDEIQAAILRYRLRGLEAHNDRRTTLSNAYRSALKGLPLTLQAPTPGCEPAWHLCVIAVESSEVRQRLMQYLSDKEIQTLIHYPLPTHRQRAFEGCRAGDLQHTENLTDRICSLPMNVTLTESEQAWVVENVRSFFGA